MLPDFRTSSQLKTEAGILLFRTAISRFPIGESVANKETHQPSVGGLAGNPSFQYQAVLVRYIRFGFDPTEISH